MIRKSLLILVLLFTFLSVNLLFATTVAHFTTNYDNGGTIVAGEPVVFTSDSTSTNPPMECRWDFNNDGNVDAIGNPVTHSFPTSGNHTVKLTVIAGDDVETYLRQFPVKPWSVELKSVGFKTADGVWYEIYRDIEDTIYSSKPNEPYAENPQWQDNSDPLNGTATDAGDKKYPVAYKSGSQMQVQVIIHGKGPVPQPMWIYGKGTESFNFAYSAGGIQVDWDVNTLIGCNVINCDKDFDSNKVKGILNFDIEWFVKCGAGNFESIGNSQNDLYVTKTDPLQTGDFQLGNLYHTYVHLACANSDNQTVDSAIISGIWSGFTGKNVKRRQDGSDLKFRQPWETNVGIARTLITGTNGTSRAWAEFFINVLKVHNIHQDHNKIEVISDTDDVKIAFNTWDFKQNPVQLLTGYPYSNVQEKNTTDKHEWTYENVSDSPGVGGQNSTNPKSILEEFFLSCYGGIYYDVAHGISYTSLTNFESNAVAGYVKEESADVGESIIGADLNNDNDTDDIVDTDVAGFKQNPTGDQLDYSSYTN